MSSEIGCHEAKTLIPFMLDEEISQEEKERVLHHTEHCPDCKVYLDQQRTKRYLSKHHPPIGPPADNE